MPVGHQEQREVIEGSFFFVAERDWAVNQNLLGTNLTSAINSQGGLGKPACWAEASLGFMSPSVRAHCVTSMMVFFSYQSVHNNLYIYAQPKYSDIIKVHFISMIHFILI